ncbi:MAG: exopolyphosphatase [Candidatus Gastranaerophilales bacterium]|nr:exopolyphosphatase [Candidatus Gastranaerophilales bacterium]
MRRTSGSLPTADYPAGLHSSLSTIFWVRRWASEGTEREEGMSVKTFAAIDVGSYEMAMKIFEFGGKNRMRVIDSMTLSLDLGSESYANGKISNEKIDELCRVLKRFCAVMKTYKVEAYRAYGTSAIREIQNTAIVLDKIEQRTGIKIEILSNSEQRFLDYKSVASRGESFRRIIEEKTAIVDIGGGSIQISLFDNDTLVSTQNLRIGVLRLQEILHHLNVGSAQIEKLIDELASAQLSTYKKLYLKEGGIKNIIVVDDYISPWVVRQAQGDDRKAMIDREKFEKLKDLMAGGNFVQAAKTLDMPVEKVPLTFISAILVSRIAKLMDAAYIWAPGVTLCDGIAYEYAEKNKMLKGEHDFERDIVACAYNISKRYMGSRKRAETLEKITGTIFDSMKKVHGLGKRERLYLEIATILQDCGKYISMSNIGETSYNIVMATEIIGLSHVERTIIANMVLFHRSPFVYYGQQGPASGLEREDYLKVAKLTAILRLAGSLDRSHRQKLKGVKAFVQDNELVLTVETLEDITLERNSFEHNADFFMEVFSIRPVLKQKKVF